MAWGAAPGDMRPDSSRASSAKTKCQEQHKIDRANGCVDSDIDLFTINQVNTVDTVVVGGQSSECNDRSCLDCRIVSGASSNTSHKTFVAPNRAPATVTWLRASTYIVRLPIVSQVFQPTAADSASGHGPQPLLLHSCNT